MDAGEIADLFAKAGVVVDRADHRDPDRFAGTLVVLAEPGRHLDYPGALVHGDEVRPEHDKSARGVGEIAEHG